LDEEGEGPREGAEEEVGRKEAEEGGEKESEEASEARRRGRGLSEEGAEGINGDAGADDKGHDVGGKARGEETR
jgi:hypothetical protein